ncbi:MAG TPA: acetyl-CoA hydrolase/transferase family protein [Paludibacter sp.]|nr:acetyl-CoA hydrolase/transferase family protein [Paludibacter sp.]
MQQTYKFVTAEEAASYVNNGDIIGFSGFTPAGCPKEVPTAIAKRAEAFHAEGKEFKVGMYTGASTGDSLDGALARANAILFRTPYQSNKDLRSALNAERAPYFDMHLSSIAPHLRFGFMPKPKFAIIEVCDITKDGKLIPTTGVGISPTIANLADHIIVELNHNHPKELYGFHDIFEPKDPPYRAPLTLMKPSDRMGVPYIQVDPKKILCVVETWRDDEVSGFTPTDEVTDKIGQNVANFLANEIKTGRVPKEFLPIQSGVGNIANAVMASLGVNPDIPNFEMYTEVIQDSVIGLIKNGKIKFASGCSLTITTPVLHEIYADLEFFRDKLVLRPQEMSNSPELARRLGLITINTALEADIFGNVNSTHVMGSKMMNGIGGSADFTRSAYISIFTTPSTAKNGNISAIVPMVTHVDQNEHSVNILITEHGVADLRGKSPIQRAEEIIGNCVAPEYRPMLNEYLKLSGSCHTPQNLSACFGMHAQFMKTGSMLGTNWEDYISK